MTRGGPGATPDGSGTPPEGRAPPDDPGNHDRVIRAVPDRFASGHGADAGGAGDGRGPGWESGIRTAAAAAAPLMLAAPMRPDAETGAGLRWRAGPRSRRAYAGPGREAPPPRFPGSAGHGASALARRAAGLNWPRLARPFLARARTYGIGLVAREGRPAEAGEGAPAWPGRRAPRRRPNPVKPGESEKN